MRIESPYNVGVFRGHSKPKGVIVIIKTQVHTEGKYSVVFNSQVNAYNPYSVINTQTGKVEFTYKSLDVCLDYISDNLRGLS